ncbi:unnamed protein product, partial [Effrenium voratum]
REKRRHGRHGALGTSPSAPSAPALATAMCPRKRSRGPRLFESPEYHFSDLRADDVVQGLTWRDERLGEGAFAQVLKCWSPKHGYVAVKVLKHRSFCEEVSLEAEAEAAILRSLAHPHIVRMLDFFELEGHVCLALELLGLTLLQLLEGHVQGLRQETVKEIARQVLLALEYLGRLELIHGDLKPENVLMDPGCRARGRLHVKAFQCSPSTSGAGGQVFQCGHGFVADFGAARRISDEEVTIQTLPYRAPEVLLGGRRICCKVDVWSLGAICIELYTGEPLFDHQFTQEEVVAGIDQLLGPIPEEMLCRGTRTAEFFERTMHRTCKPPGRLAAAWSWVRSLFREPEVRFRLVWETNRHRPRAPREQRSLKQGFRGRRFDLHWRRGRVRRLGKSELRQQLRLRKRLEAVVWRMLVVDPDARGTASELRLLLGSF